MRCTPRWLTVPLLIVPQLMGCAEKSVVLDGAEPPVSCSDLTERLGSGQTFAQSNVLIILTDDIGTDRTAAWGDHPTPAATPTLDALACAGTAFRNTYAHPTCSPSRATLHTGRAPSRYGIGRWLSDTGGWGLPLAEVTLPELLGEAGYASAVAGKWHLGPATHPDAPTHPLDQGYWHHRGSFSNLLMAFEEGHTPRGYWQWERLDDGVADWSTDYNTTVTTDDALDLLEVLPEPWLLYVAYNSAHEPLHLPPEHLLLAPEAVHAGSPTPALYDAMVTATDLEIGRLLDNIDDDVLADTLVIYLSDNGTPKWGLSAPLDPARGKGTAFEGGVRVPFIAAGPGVSTAGAWSDGLVGFADIFPTLAELVGVDLATWVPEGAVPAVPLELDGYSLVDVLDDPSQSTARTTAMGEGFYPAGGGPYDWTRRTVVDGSWKYVLLEGEDSTLDPDVDTREELYRLVVTDPSADTWALDEGPDLLAAGPLDAAAQAAYDRLSADMAQQLAARPFEY